jgi:rod shape-determining protein MreC
MRFIYTKTFAIFFSCLVIISGLFFLQTKGYLDPVSSLFLQAPQPIIRVSRSIVNSTKSFFKTFYNLRSVLKENTELQQKVFLLEQNLVTFEQEKKENSVLRNELGFFRQAKNELIPCSVLTHNTLGVSDSIVINCGTNQGVEEGLAVVSQGYLVGKVIFVSKNSSTVLLATSSKFSADAKVVQTGLKSIVQGSFGSGLVLVQLPQNEKIEKGMLVATAGINEKIPKNILFGELGEITSLPTDLFKKMTIISPIDFNNIEFVFVAK